MRNRLRVATGAIVLVLLIMGGAVASGVISHRNTSIVLFFWLAALACTLAARSRRRGWLVVFGVSLTLATVETALYFSSLLRSRSIESPGVGHDFPPVAYEADGRRSSVAPAAAAAHEKMHALFLGGSFTFGWGVRDDQTLASTFQRAAGGKFAAYNFGRNALGTSGVYLLLGRDEAMESVGEKRGIAVYTFIDDHLNRNLPYQIHKLAFSYPDADLFELGEDANLRGPYRFEEREALARFIARYRAAVEFSPLFRLIGERFPLKWSSDEEAYRMLVQLLLESKRLYDARFEGDFYVLLWPRHVRRGRHLREAVTELREHGIGVIEVPPLPDASMADLSKHDPHPSPAEYRWVAERLYEEIMKWDQASEPE